MRLTPLRPFDLYPKPDYEHRGGPLERLGTAKDRVTLDLEESSSDRAVLTLGLILGHLGSAEQLFPEKY